MSQKGLQLHPNDNCIVSLADVAAGETLVWAGGTLTARSAVGIGHKLAIVAIDAGEKVLKYGAVIGSATTAIAPGDHIHTHNLASDYLVGFHH